MELIEFHKFIQNIPYKNHAFDIKNANWKVDSQQGLIDKIFNGKDIITLNRILLDKAKNSGNSVLLEITTNPKDVATAARQNYNTKLRLRRHVRSQLANCGFGHLTQAHDQPVEGTRRAQRDHRQTRHPGEFELQTT